MWNTIGHDRALRALRRGLDSDRVSHSILIAGPPQVGKTTLAFDIARAVNCEGSEEWRVASGELPVGSADAHHYSLAQPGDRPCGECGQCGRISSGLHPDVRVVGLEKARSGRLRTLIGIEQVRDVQRETSLLPFEGRSRVIIFETAELLSEEAANSLLKTLEEPPERVLIILLATDARAMLPTIVSRCRLVQLRPAPSAAIAEFLAERKGVNPDRAREIAGLASGRVGWAVRAAEDPDMLKRMSDALDEVESVVRSPLAERFDYAAALAGRFPGDRRSVYSELELWLSWWRDVLLVGQRKPELVSNVARIDSLTQAAERLPQTSIVGAIRTVMRTTFLLERNVFPRLALEGMMLKLPAVS